MGALEVINFADFTVDTSGCVIEYAAVSQTARLRFTKRFIAGMHQILSWLFVSDSFEATEEMVCRASREVAEFRGYAAEVEVTP